MKSILVLLMLVAMVFAAPAPSYTQPLVYGYSSPLAYAAATYGLPSYRPTLYGGYEAYSSYPGAYGYPYVNYY